MSLSLLLGTLLGRMAKVLVYDLSCANEEYATEYRGEGGAQPNLRAYPISNL